MGIQRARSKRNWSLSKPSFHGLLDWLDAGEASNGERYVEMRRRLVSYFGRKGRRNPDDLADETLNRIARRLEEEGGITDTPPARYCYIVAKFVFLEDLRLPAAVPLPHTDSGPVPSAATARPQESFIEEGQQEDERRMSCLDECVFALPPDDRTLVLEYYQGAQRSKIENRHNLSTLLGCTANALAIRACRIRSRLATCVNRCLQRRTPCE